MGQADGFGAVKVMNLFRDIAHIRKNRIGKITCEDHRAFVYIDNEDAKAAIAAFKATPGAPAIGYAPLSLNTAAPYPEKAAKKSAERVKV